MSSGWRLEVGGSVEDLSLGQWSVVGGSAKDLSVGWWSVVCGGWFFNTPY